MGYNKMGIINFIGKVIEKLKGKWIAAISSSVILAFLVFVIGDIINLSPVYCIPVIGFIALGEIVFMRKLLGGQNAQLEDLFKEYKSFISAFLTTASLVILLGVGFALLIVPGILILVTYSFALHILEEDKTIGTLEALEKSKEFTKGYRGKIGIFYLVFLLIIIIVFGVSLAISLIPNLIWGTSLLLIAGIIAGILGTAFICPLFYASITMFYDELKNGAFEKTAKKVKVEEKIETVEAESVEPEEIE